jgi:hypothetical protein
LVSGRHPQGATLKSHIAKRGARICVPRLLSSRRLAALGTYGQRISRTRRLPPPIAVIPRCAGHDRRHRYCSLSNTITVLNGRPLASFPAAVAVRILPYRIAFTVDARNRQPIPHCVLNEPHQRPLRAMVWIELRLIHVCLPAAERLYVRSWFPRKILCSRKSRHSHQSFRSVSCGSRRGIRLRTQ